ncbi:MAG: hypothetical protein L3J42_05845, partial [Hydrogenimonas sp.]|nr:hypothetical protein [Hydrogenimonas sp.]
IIELINLKAKKPAVSIVSLFLLTLAIIVYVGAFFTGKADGSHAFSLLTPEAKEELKFHKLLGTYLVYGSGILLLLKAGAMAIRRAWARNVFIFFLLIFIATLLKQGKDGGELVYEYGVNVKPVMALQDRLDDMQFDMEDLKEELVKAKAECEQKSKSAPTSLDENASSSTAIELNESAPQEKMEPSSQAPAESNDSNISSDSSAPAETAPSTYRQVAPPAGMTTPATVQIPTH